MAEKGGTLPKFGEWDVNDPASAEGFTVIFNKARNEKKTGHKVESPPQDNKAFKHGEVLRKPQSEDMEFTVLTNYSSSNISSSLLRKQSKKMVLLHAISCRILREDSN